MGDFFFVVKCLIATLVLLVFMQIRVGYRTIEQHSVRWIQQSSAVEELRLVAEGAVRAAHVGYEKASAYIGQGDSETYQRRVDREEREPRRGSASIDASEN
jgi:hypothetical protein